MASCGCFRSFHPSLDLSPRRDARLCAAPGDRDGGGGATEASRLAWPRAIHEPRDERADEGVARADGVHRVDLEARHMAGELRRVQLSGILKEIR